MKRRNLRYYRPYIYSIARMKLKGRISIPNAVFKILIDPKQATMTGFVIPNNSALGKDFRIYQVKVREVEKLTGLDFNPRLTRALAEKMEAVNRGGWVMPSGKSHGRNVQ